MWSDSGLGIGLLMVACMVACVWGCESLSKVWLRIGGEVCTCLTHVGAVMGMKSVSSDGAASFFEVRGAGGDCKIVSRLGSKEAAFFVLGFSFFLVIPLEVAGSGLDGKWEGSFLIGFFGFQLEIEAISADVILPMGSDVVEAICSADSDGDGVGAAGAGSPRHSQSWMSWVGVDGWDDGVYMMLPRVSVTRYPETEESDFFGPLLAFPRCSGDLGCFRFLSFMVRKGGRGVEKFKR